LTTENGARKHRFDISLEDLQTFIAVANLGGIGRAARHLHLSQPSISNRIRRLEEKLSVRLLERSERGVRLTDQGRLLHQQAVETLVGLNDLLQDFHTNSSDGKRAIRLAVAVPMAQFKAPFLVNAYQEQATNVVVHIHEYLYGEAIDALLSGRCDFALITCDELPATLDHEVLVMDDSVLVVSKTHPLAAAKEVRLTDALAFPVLLPAERYPQLGPVYKVMENRGLTMRLAPEAEGVRHPLTLMIMAAAGLGVVISPRSFIPRELGGAIAAVGLSDCVIPRQLGLAWAKGRRLTPFARSFQSFMSDHAADLQGWPKTPIQTS
jgi:LysR family transcriptional regulator, carnitine catabolism transcriptional activator